MGKGMAWRAWHSIWLGLTMHSMEYGMTWLAWHAIWYGLVARNAIGYGLACIPWYMVWPGGYGVVYDMVWRV